MEDRKGVVAWLLAGDPAVRWQAMRDLTAAPRQELAAERTRVAREGWGAAIFARQTDDGHWNDAQEHGWMTTTDALALLRDLGVDAAGKEARHAIARVEANITWHQLAGQPFFDGETEACINGRILAAGAYFGADCDRLLERLLGEQLEDGGWNCEAPNSARSSFHSTICVLEGLLAYEEARGPLTAIANARARGHDYLLQRRLFKSLTTGEVINDNWTRFSFPHVWHYDVLRGLDYLRGAGVQYDPRLAEAVDLIEQRRDADGRWPLDDIHPDHRQRLSLDLETEIGSASRWNTLRALRVLDWYAAPPAAGSDDVSTIV